MSANLTAGRLEGRAAPASRRRSTLGDPWYIPVFFVGPQVLGFLAFVIGPITAVVYLSFFNFNIMFGTFQPIGFGNYQRLFTDPQMRIVAWNTFIFTFAYVPLSVGLGLATAVLIDTKLPAINFFRAAYFMPMVISVSAWAIVWRFLLQPSGGINGGLESIGLSGPNWLREPPLAMAWVVIVQALKNVGLPMVLFLAALQGVPREQKEAAVIDGAGRWQVFRYVTLPHIAPATFFVVILTTIVALKSFGLIYLMTNGGPGTSTSVIAYEIYSVGFQEFEQGYASALAVVLFVIIMILTVLQFLGRKRWVHYEQ